MVSRLMMLDGEHWQVCFAARLKVLVAESYLSILKAQHSNVADAERLFLRRWLTECIIVPVAVWFLTAT